MGNSESGPDHSVGDIFISNNSDQSSDDIFLEGTALKGEFIATFNKLNSSLICWKCYLIYLIRRLI